MEDHGKPWFKSAQYKKGFNNRIQFFYFHLSGFLFNGFCWYSFLKKFSPAQEALMLNVIWLQVHRCVFHWVPWVGVCTAFEVEVQLSFASWMMSCFYLRSIQNNIMGIWILLGYQYQSGDAITRVNITWHHNYWNCETSLFRGFLV